MIDSALFTGFEIHLKRDLNVKVTDLTSDWWGLLSEKMSFFDSFVIGLRGT